MSAVTGSSAIEVTTLGVLTDTRWQHWENAYHRTGVRVQQSPAYARAVHESGRKVLVATGSDVIAAFTVAGDACTAVGGDEPLLGLPGPDPARLASVVTAVASYTGLPVYLPLVDQRYAEVAGQDEFVCWERPPNAVIDWAQQGRDLWERVRSRGTSQLERKRRLVDRDGLTLDPARTGENAVVDLLAVDDRSWKAERGQSMRQRSGQSALYGVLVRQGTLTVTFLREGDTPVAFRLEARTRDRLTCLKWSYDEAYKRYSPGLYLLTEGLTRQWTDPGLRVVDLFGGPDTLKDLLHTHRIPRIDVWFGDSALGAERARDRHALDDRVGQARGDGKGLRHAYP